MICPKTRCVFVLFCLFCWITAIFQDEPVFAGQPGQKGPEITVEKESAGYAWTLKTPNRPGVVQVSLLLRDARGGPINGRLVTGEVWMPEMPMQGYPMELEFQEADSGQYVALVQYGHGGYWQIKVKFRNGEKLFQQFFDLNIKD
jgi:hypothetical protein